MNAFADHPIANIFPLMSEAELRNLASDITEHGLHEPIVLYDGMILDGRNRYRACQMAGIEPTFETFTGDNPTAFVVSLNLKRRHLSESQRAMVAARLANMPQGFRTDKPSANLPKVVSQGEAAKLLNVSDRSIRNAKEIIREDPEMAAEIEAGKVTLHRALREIDRQRKLTSLETAQKKVAAAKSKHLADVCDLRCCSFEDLLSTVRPDAVITDPPYPREFIPIYKKLAVACETAGVPVVAIMCGQRWLPEILPTMCLHLDYRWTMAYLTPGGQAAQQFDTKVNAFWKPVLLFGEAVDWIGDVAKSAPNANEKDFHDWGQSESGMADLIVRLTKPGQLVCDPFLGGGTTAVACLQLGRRFVGCDVDQACVERASARVMAL